MLNFFDKNMGKKFTNSKHLPDSYGGDTNEGGCAVGRVFTANFSQNV